MVPMNSTNSFTMSMGGFKMAHIASESLVGVGSYEMSANSIETFKAPMNSSGYATDSFRIARNLHNEEIMNGAG